MSSTITYEPNDKLASGILLGYYWEVIAMTGWGIRNGYVKLTKESPLE